MSFTDEDLRRIKDYLRTDPMKVPVYLEALIERLEAAERCIEGKVYERSIDIQLWERYVAWRKACGK